VSGFGFQPFDPLGDAAAVAIAGVARQVDVFE